MSILPAKHLERLFYARRHNLSWGLSANLNNTSIIDFVFPYVRLCATSNTTIENIENVLALMRHEFVNVSSDIDEPSGEMLFMHIQGDLRKAMCYIMLSAFPKSICSKDVHNFRAYKHMYETDVKTTRILANALISDELYHLSFTRNTIVVSFGVRWIDIDKVRRFVSSKMEEIFEFAILVDNKKGRKERFVSEAFVEKGKRFPQWMLDRHSADIVKASISEDAWILFDSDKIELYCGREYANNEWSSTWTNLICLAAGSNVTIHSITERFVINISINMSSNLRLIEKTIKEDAVLSSIVQLVDSFENNRSSLRSNSAACNDISEAILLFRMWDSDLQESNVCVKIRIPKGKYQRVTKAYVSSMILLSHDDKVLISLIIDIFCRSYTRTYKNSGTFHNDMLVTLRRELPDYIPSNYSRENPIIPIVVSPEEAMELEAMNTRVLKFPRDTTNPKFLVAPDGYYIGVKMSKRTRSYIPVCYKKDNFLNTKSVTWKYVHGYENPVKESNGLSFMTTLRSMPKQRRGVLPFEFSMGNEGEYCRFGMGHSFLSAILHILNASIHDISFDHNSIHVCVSFADNPPTTRKIYAAVCKQELRNQESSDILSCILRRFAEDNFTPLEYRFIEELFDITIIWFSIVDGVYKDILLPGYNAQHNDCYLWPAYSKHKRPFVLMFVNKFHSETTYEIVIDCSQSTPTDTACLKNKDRSSSRRDNFGIFDSENSLVQEALSKMRYLTFFANAQRHEILDSGRAVGQIISSDGKTFGIVWKDSEKYGIEPCFLPPLSLPEHYLDSESAGASSSFSNMKEKALQKLGKSKCLWFKDEETFIRWATLQRVAMTKGQLRKE